MSGDHSLKDETPRGSISCAVVNGPPRKHSTGAHRFSDQDLRGLMGEVARLLLGTPNRVLSKGSEMRYGARGSFKVDLKKGTWSDFERDEGGGVLDLVERETGLRGDARFDWLRKNGFDGSDNGYEPGERKKEERLHTSGDRHPTLGKPATTYPYRNATGELLFEVARFVPKTFRPRQPDGNGGWFWDLQGLDDKFV